MKTWLVISRAGPNRDLSNGSREQTYWDEHAAHIDRLVEEGFILLGGPFPDNGGALLVVQAESEDIVRKTIEPDPWYQHGNLVLERVQEWDIFINKMKPSA